VAVYKTQRMGARALTLRAELMNALNDPAFRGPIVGFGRSDFGRITTVGGFARTLQLMARMAW